MAARPTARVDERTLEILRHRRTPPHVHRRGWLIRRGLAVADAVGLIAAFAVADALFGWQTGPGGAVAGWGGLLVFLATVPGWLLLAHLRGLYRHDEERVEHTTPDEFAEIFDLVTVGVWLFGAVAWLTGAVKPEYRTLFAFWALAVVLVGTARAAARALCRRGTAYVQNAVIVGAGKVGRLVARKVRDHPEYGINLVGFVDAGSPALNGGPGAVPALGRPSELLEIVSEYGVERVIFAPSPGSDEQLLDLACRLRAARCPRRHRAAPVRDHG